MSETSPNNPNQIDSSVETLRNIDAERAAKIGQAVFGPLTEIELPSEVDDAKLSLTGVDTTNLPLINAVRDAYESGLQTTLSPNVISAQVDEAWQAKEAHDNNHDRSALLALEAELDENVEESMKDKLTGLPNREAMELLASKIGVEGMEGVALIDLNDFKTANDHFGHAAGDEVLQRHSDILKTQVTDRGLGEVFRIGGDEFAAVFYKGQSLEDIQTAMKMITGDTAEIKLQRTKESPDDPKVEEWSAGASVGYAESTKFHDLAQGLVEADQDMFAKKEASRPDGYVGRQRDIKVSS